MAKRIYVYVALQHNQANFVHFWLTADVHQFPPPKGQRQGLEDDGDEDNQNERRRSRRTRDEDRSGRYEEWA